MKKSFTLPRTDALAENPSSLMAEIVSATGSETEAASILRSLCRLGTDPSIRFYEMTLVTKRSRQGGAATSAWRVRADRGTAPAPAPPLRPEGESGSS